ncbi:MAG: hypothetical protein K0Q50_1619 [Vampirovibrio sp.]|jgi:uncharacterized protein (DUF488 family)|nr:hypothetical protein [Vampirovibrio sp.]
MVNIYTIGFTQTSARQFFETLKQASIKRLIDTRLSNVSQLAGFAKKADLEYFLAQILGAEYVHLPQLLSPAQPMLDEYRKQKGSWSDYKRQFLALIQERRIETQLSPEQFLSPTVLLCSEHEAEHCHRRLIVEYLDRAWGNINAIHL